MQVNNSSDDFRSCQVLGIRHYKARALIKIEGVNPDLTVIQNASKLPRVDSPKKSDEMPKT